MADLDADAPPLLAAIERGKETFDDWESARQRIRDRLA